jgi:hypothetical protein
MTHDAYRAATVVSRVCVKNAISGEVSGTEIDGLNRHM